MTASRSTIPGEPGGALWRPYAAMFVAVFFFAAAFPMISFALTELSPANLASARFFLAGLLGLVWLMRSRGPRARPSQHLRFALCGLFGMTLYSLLLNLGQLTVSAGAASFLISAVPVLTALLAFILWRERLGPLGLVGTAIAVGGVGLIAANQPGGLVFGAGASAVLGAALCAAIFVVMLKPLVPVFGALDATARTMVYAALFLLPWLPGAAVQLGTASLATMLTVVGLTVFSSVAYLASSYALGRLPAGVQTSFAYVIPPLATVMAWLFLRDVPALVTLLGGALAVVGTALVNYKGQAAGPPRPKHLDRTPSPQTR